MDDKEKIEKCYCQMYRGMVDKDLVFLSEVLDKLFVLVHMTRMRQPKEEFIQAVENGILNYSARHQHMEDKIQGDWAKPGKRCGIRWWAEYMASAVKIRISQKR